MSKQNRSSSTIDHPNTYSLNQTRVDFSKQHMQAPGSVPISEDFSAPDATFTSRADDATPRT